MSKSIEPAKEPGQVRYQVEIVPHDCANDGRIWEIGTSSPAEAARVLRGYADWVETAATS